MDNQTSIDNKGLVISIAKRYQGKGLDFDDLVQEGYIGLIKASTHYNDTKGAKFSTYASYWIKQAIIRAIETTGSLIRVPSHCNTMESPNHIEIKDNADSSTYNILNSNHLVTSIKTIINNDLDSAMYLDYYMHDLSYRDLSSKYSMSHQTIKNKLDILHEIVKRKLTI